MLDADDPVRALRWGLAEIRRALGDDGAISGDPVSLELGADATVDVAVVLRGSWIDAVRLPGLGADLLEGMVIRGAAAFETWLLPQQRHLAAAAEAILHEAALGAMSHGRLEAGIGYAVRAAAMSPLEENHQALLIRLYRTAGDDAAAARQLAAVRARPPPRPPGHDVLGADDADADLQDRHEGPRAPLAATRRGAGQRR